MRGVGRDETRCDLSFNTVVKQDDSANKHRPQRTRLVSYSIQSNLYKHYALNLKLCLYVGSECISVIYMGIWDEKGLQFHTSCIAKL